MRKLFLLCIVALTFTEIVEAKITSKLSDGTVLQFPDGTAKDVIERTKADVKRQNTITSDSNYRNANEATKEAIRNKHKIDGNSVPSINRKPTWEKSEFWEKDALVLTFNSKGEREYTPEELGIKPKENKINLPDGYKLEEQKPNVPDGYKLEKKPFSFEEAQTQKKGQSPDEWLAAQKKVNEKSFASKIAGLFGPTNAAECVQKYAPKLKFSDALNLIYRACAIGHSNGLDSKLVSASKCIINKTDEIYSNESGLKIINNCTKDIPYAFGYFANSLNEAQDARVSEQITNQINAQSRNRNIQEESQTRFFQIYDSTTQQYKNCYGTGSFISCQ